MTKRRERMMHLSAKRRDGFQRGVSLHQQRCRPKHVELTKADGSTIVGTLAPCAREHGLVQFKYSAGLLVVV